MISFDTLNLPSSQHSQDRVHFRETLDGFLALLADGAGGVAGGAAAAEKFIEHFDSLQTLEKTTLCREFAALDSSLHHDPITGDTTGIVAVAREGRIFGASVGDSQAWFLPTQGEPTELTARQARKPLLGSGEAWAVPFSYPLEPGTLLLCSDGLHKYADHQRILARIREQRPEDLTTDLANLARMPSGGLQDDLSVIVVRINGDIIGE